MERLEPGFNTIGHTTQTPACINMSTHGYSLHDHSMSMKAPGKLYLSKPGTSTTPQREVSTKESGAAITRIGLLSSAHSGELNQYFFWEEETPCGIQSISLSQGYAGISQSSESQLTSPATPQPLPRGTQKWSQTGNSTQQQASNRFQKKATNTSCSSQK